MLSTLRSESDFRIMRHLSNQEERAPMQTRGIHYLLVFLSFIVVIGLACSSLTTTPTTAPESTGVPATQAPSDTSNSSSATDTGSSALVTFTDKNKYYQIQLPGDWKHTTSSGEHSYWDTFTSPDSGAVIENYAYDDGTPWTGKDSGKYALAVLNQLYSQTGKEGDIRISEEKLQQDGSDRLTWTSKSGGYSGISFFEIRNSSTFLMFTVNWGNDYKDQYFDMLNTVISSYQVP
jgi:hypothetical protein